MNARTRWSYPQRGHVQFRHKTEVQFGSPVPQGSNMFICIEIGHGLEPKHFLSKTLFWEPPCVLLVRHSPQSWNPNSTIESNHGFEESMNGQTWCSRRATKCWQRGEAFSWLCLEACDFGDFLGSHGLEDCCSLFLFSSSRGRVKRRRDPYAWNSEISTIFGPWRLEAFGASDAPQHVTNLCDTEGGRPSAQQGRATQYYKKPHFFFRNVDSRNCCFGLVATRRIVATLFVQQCVWVNMDRGQKWKKKSEPQFRTCL